MTYKTGEIGYIFDSNGFILRNGIKSVENPQGDWFKYMYVLNACECEIGYKCCNEKRAGFDYIVDLFKFMNHISEQMLTLGVNIRDENIVERLRQVKFLNENGNFVIIDGDEKIIVGKLLDDEFIVQINGAWNEYLLPFVTEYCDLQRKAKETNIEEDLNKKIDETKTKKYLCNYEIMREIDNALNEINIFK